MPPRVLVTDHAWPSLDVERSVLGDAELVAAATGEPGELIALAAGADAILTNWRPIPPAALDAATRCVVVSRYGVGTDNIPVARASELGVVVANVPDYCVEEVSDHVMALLLACARRLVPYASDTAEGNWRQEGAAGLPRLRGQTLGLVGAGAIARALVPKALGFGLRVLAHTPRIRPGALGPHVETTTDLGRLLAESDYVSLHAPATPETDTLIGAEQLACMKPGAFLINTARGALVDEAALVAALEAATIAGAALDVLRDEPPSADRPLLRHPKAMVTPHVAFSSAASIEEVARRAAAHVADALAGRVPPHVVNPEVLASPRLRLQTSPS